MKARVAFYRYNKKIFNAGISVWTWFFTPRSPAYSHAEIGVLVAGKWEYFSSTNRDNAKGTRWIKEKCLFKHRDRWDVYEIKVKSREDIIKSADSINGLPYDWPGIFGFITPFGLINSKHKWYCSEACYFVLTGEWKKRISPRRFYAYIKKTHSSYMRKVL